MRALRPWVHVRALTWHLNRLLGRPGWTGLAVLLLTGIAFVFWLEPQNRHMQRLTLDVEQARARARSELAEVAATLPGEPAPRADAKLATPENMSATIDELHRLAKMLNIELANGQYLSTVGSEHEPPVLEITIPVKASYRAARAFVMMSLNTMPALALREFSARRTQIDNPLLDVRLQFALLMRTPQ